MKDMKRMKKNNASRLPTECLDKKMLPLNFVHFMNFMVHFT